MIPLHYSQLDQDIRSQVRREYVFEQDYKCLHCGADLRGPPAKKKQKTRLYRTYPKEFFKHPIHLHHDHETDLVIGAVHAKCNAILYEYYGE